MSLTRWRESWRSSSPAGECDIRHAFRDASRMWRLTAPHRPLDDRQLDRVGEVLAGEHRGAHLDAGHDDAASGLEALDAGAGRLLGGHPGRLGDGLLE